MAADDLSLLFRLRGDASSLRAASAEARASVNQLKQSFGPELTSTVTVANKAFGDLAQNLNVFVGQRIPLVGGTFLRITENLRNFGVESKAADKAIASVANSIANIAKESGKSVPQIAQFLTRFVQLEGQAKRDVSAIEFFGASLGAKLIPQLESASTELGALATESTAAGGALAGMALPIAAAVIAIAALVAGVVIATRELIQLTKHTAEFQGKMLDLSQATGLGVETLSTLEVAAKTTGGTLDSIAASLGLFQRKLEDASDPTSKGAELFRRLGVEATDTETALRQTLAALARMPEGAQQTALALEAFGRGGRQVLAILKETNGDLDGLTQRLREAGVLITSDAARAADKLNDELALLDFQLRAAGADIAKELIPALTDMARNLAEVIRATRPLLELFSQIAGPVARHLARSLQGLSVVVKALTLDYQGLRDRIREVNEEAAKARDIPAPQIPGPQPVELPDQQSPAEVARQAAQTADVVVAAAKRAATETNQALSEAFERGRINRQRQAEDTIAANARVLDAEKKRVAAQIELKDEEARQLQRREDLSATERLRQLGKLNEDVQKLRQQELDAESLFETTSREIRARAAVERANSRRNQVRNETDILIGELDRQISATEAAIQRGEQVESSGLAIIEQIEQAKIEARHESLQEQQRLGFLTLEAQRDLDAQIRQLEQDADRLREEQQRRREQRQRETTERQRQQRIAEIESLLDAERIAGESLIATVQAQAALRIRTEEDAAREILRIRLQLIDDEAAAIRAQITAAGAITDVNQRTQVQAELNNRLRVLLAQRAAIQGQGNRDISAAQQDDLANERRYADDLRDIQERIASLQRDVAEEVVRTMVRNFASRRSIIRAQTQLDLDDENARHERANADLERLRQENATSNRTQAEKLEVEKELNRLREAEAERHRQVMQGIRDQGRKDEEKASPLGKLKLDIEDLKNFVDVVEQSVIPLGQILTSTFQQVADAIGQTVANWVLLGTTGPAVMRKILAQALAAVAAEAAVNAIKELALGFAALGLAFLGHPTAGESAGAHFAAAALWGSIAGVSAVVGRGVAGNLFQQGTGATASAGGRGGTGDNHSTAPNPIDLVRQQQQQELHIFVHAEPGGRFNESIVQAFVDDVRINGPSRTTIVETVGA